MLPGHLTSHRLKISPRAPTQPRDTPHDSTLARPCIVNTVFSCGRASAHTAATEGCRYGPWHCESAWHRRHACLASPAEWRNWHKGADANRPSGGAYVVRACAFDEAFKTGHAAMLHAMGFSASVDHFPCSASAIPPVNKLTQAPATQAHRACFDVLPSKVVARVPEGAIEACPWAEQPSGTVQEALFVRYALIAAAEVRICAVLKASLAKGS